MNFIKITLTYIFIFISLVLFGSLFLVRNFTFLSLEEGLKRITTVPDNRISQEIYVTQPNLYEVYIRLKNTSIKNLDPFKFSLLDDKHTTVREITINGSNIGDGEWVPFAFAPIPDSQGKTFFITLESPSPEETAVEVATSTNTDYNPARIGNESVGHPLAFRLARKLSLGDKVGLWKNHLVPETKTEKVFLVAWAVLLLFLIKLGIKPNSS